MLMDSWDRAYLWRFRATVEAVHDGDTLDVLVDTGFGGRHLVHIRLSGINAPELNTPEGKVAQAGLDAKMETLDGRWPLRVETVQLKTIVGEATTFERYVADVWFFENGQIVSLSTFMVAMGWAEYREYNDARAL